jgi:hypothetical protein
MIVSAQNCCGAALLATALVLCAGCGLSDYEQKMDETQKTQRMTEDARKLLAKTPIKLPESKNKDETKKAEEESALAPFANFRPPSTVRIEFQGKVGPLFKFPGGSEFKDVLIGVTTADRPSILHALDLDSAGKTPVALKLAKGGALQLDVYKGQNPTYATRAYFYEKSPYQIVIVFRWDPSRPVSELSERAIEASLRTIRF